MKKNTAISLALSTLFAGLAHAADAPTVAATPEHTLAGNLSLNSDYRFRGISQTWKLPAVQGGLDYAHSSGFYAGTWASNVSGNSYNNGAGLELDLYSGYKLGLGQDLTLDLGALAYVYPGATLNSAPGVATDKKYTNVDLYAGLTAGAFSAKLSIAATDYFGLNSDTAGFAYFSALAAQGSSKGTAYLDLNYNFDLGQGLTLGTHLGYLKLRNYGDLSYADAKLSLAKEMLSLNWTVAVVGTNANSEFYQAGNSAGLDAKKLGKTGLVLSIRKTF
ncbi:TorF family putative porin [Paucibacter sp. B2R-40]|uniref:TorF family putative porin n=1 Tax=Paucibacter sp. B2R-40 TaxID=2893554 RepID=UPI0021E398D0|nr:TorF family putative porin [Paucibacter sp. B2R-40]MCV2354475.1 TorF family putative porin [Paucibacter sp. B2R-40]